MNAPDAPRPIYLDYAATTPLDPGVAAAMAECFTADGTFGNPSSSSHAFGREAAARVERARESIAALIDAPAECIVLTSGATESINLALLGSVRAAVAARRHVVTSRTEHRAGLDACRQLESEGVAVTYLTPDTKGILEPEQVRAALRSDTALASIMHANNEIGVVQDIDAIGAICRERDVLLHVDAAQSVGKLPLQVSDLPIDLMSFTAHKLYGPKGIGALYVAKRARGRIVPLLFGGGQERGLRPGTLATHQVVGFGVAAEIAATVLPTEAQRIVALRERLWQALRAVPGSHLNGDARRRVPGLLNVSFEHVEGESLLAALTGIAVSSGSACSSASQEPSYVLRACGRSTELAQGSLRFSVGRFTTAADIDTAGSLVREQVTRLRAVAA